MALYEGNDNTWCARPPDRTVCAELALLRLFSANLDAKCVYVAGKQEIVNAMFDHWEPRFGDSFGLTVSKLTSDTTVDHHDIGGFQYRDGNRTSAGCG